MQIKKIAIIGLGFMAGSLSLALKKKFPKVLITGYARSNRSYQKLKKLKIVDKLERDYKRAVKDADLVVLGLPVEVVLEYLKLISPVLKPGAIVFDLGSSKQRIEKAANKFLPKSAGFVGCHPLCGSEKSGAEFSYPELYQGSLCLITASSKAKASISVKKLWQSLGATVIFLSPRQHDKILSATSHLPHLISFSLTKATPLEYLKFSSGSFRDLTRISASRASLWKDIFVSNKENILKDLKSYIKVLSKFEKTLRSGDQAGLARLIKQANQRHLLISKKSNGNSNRRAGRLR